MPQIVIKPSSNPKEHEVWWDGTLVGVYPEHSVECVQQVRKLMKEQADLNKAEWSVQV